MQCLKLAPTVPFPQADLSVSDYEEQGQLPRRFTAPPPGYGAQVDFGPRGLMLSRSYSAKGQVAGHGFVDPSFIPARLLVFEDGACFGLLWHDLRKLSMFSRMPL